MVKNRFASTIPVLAVATLCLAQAPALAQQPPTAEAAFTEEVEVAEVLLDVLVTDRDGNVIVGLNADDFEVTEDGKPVRLDSATFYSNRPRLDAAGARVEEAASERYFILFFHDHGAANVEAPGLLTRYVDASRRAKEWLASLQLDDYVAVVGYRSSLVVHQDFTRDRSRILEAIDASATGRDAEGNWPSRLPAEGGPSLLRNLPRGRELLDRTADVQEAIAEVAKASEPLVGRKNLVLFSGGFGRLNDFGMYVPDPRRYEPMVEALNDANVAVYAMDLFPPGTEHPLESALSDVSAHTGGKFFANALNFLTPLEQVASEASGYYLLAYQAPHPRGESGFQEVRVRVRNPEFRVTARRGYSFGETAVEGD
jgi:VWFA-related protein